MTAYLVDIIAKPYFGEVTVEGKYGNWVCARPKTFDSFKERLHYAWKVLIGECDVLVWCETKKGKQQ